MSEALAAGAPAPKSRPRKIDGLRLIALFKFVKALLLIATSYGAHKLLDAQLVERLYSWSSTLSDDRMERKLIERALDWVEDLGAHRMQIFVAVTAAYTAVVLVEGTGLWMRKTWAEWLTVLFTASLVPFELWELIRHPPGHRLPIAATTLLNVLVVVYLVWFIRRQRLKPASDPRATPAGRSAATAGPSDPT
jgi:uncharacterized membrane protein (DUF2068 family)